MGFFSEFLKDLANLETVKKAERVWSVAFGDPGGDWEYNQELKRLRDSEEQQENEPDQSDTLICP